MNLKLDLDLKKVLPALRVAQPYVFGLALIGVFAYTAYVVNAAVNVKATAEVSGAPAATPSAKVSFDKTTIEALKKLQVVQGDVPTGSLGTHDPFR